MLERQSARFRDSEVHAGINQLITELTYYRRHSARLEKVNQLYSRIAGIVNLSSMLESYSAWLTQYVPHLLIGYHNLNRQRMHLYCSNHGPDRRQAISCAEQHLRATEPPASRCLEVSGFFAHQWVLRSGNSCGRLLLLRKGYRIPTEEIDLINESLVILAEPLNKTLDFEEILQQARKDPLTGLPNRTVFNETVESLIERARRHHHPLTLAALDLDKFKQVNDTKGHQYGDLVLQKVAGTLQQQIRYNDLLVRMGGDEFLLVLTDTDQTAAEHLCARLCSCVESLDIRAGQELLSLSIGLAQWEPSLTTSQWLEKADDTLYRVKARGGGGVAVTEPTTAAAPESMVN